MESDVQQFWQKNPCGAELVGDLNDRSRGEYESFFARYDDYRYTKEAHILNCLDAIGFEGKRVLEIGLGQGADGEQIVRRGGIYSGVDLTEEAANRTRMRFTLKDLPFEIIEQASALKLPFEDNSFDIVFSHGVLHHIPDIKIAQKEISRVLRPDGKLVAMLYANWSLNYLVSILVFRRLGLLAMYFFGLKADGIYGDHVANARTTGIWKYLSIDNFINVSTDGAFNPYSKVYGMADLKADFSDFEILKSGKYFMYAPPLPVSWLPLESLLGWHLWTELKPKRS